MKDWGDLPRRGFAAMEPDKRREIAARGGAGVRPEHRSFSKNRVLAAEAGRVGGTLVPAERRSFSANRALAAEAGRKGGRCSQAKRRGK